jgi:uncharacterized protein
MPGPYTYPGVYIEEVPSGVRTITGVSTSNTAFVDVFLRGPVNLPVRITSFADFERIFGGVNPASEASYAIQQYYLNGGQIAWVVRVATNAALASSVELDGGYGGGAVLTVEAANPGAWGDNLQVAVTDAGSGRYNLSAREIRDLGNGKVLVLATETFRNLSTTTTDARYGVSVVNADSQMVHLTEAGLGGLPTLATPTSSGGVPDSAWQNLTGGADSGTPDANLLAGTATAPKAGMYALDAIAPDIFNLLCLPAAANLDTGGFTSLMTNALDYCEEKRAFLIVDIPESVDQQAEMITWMTANDGLRSKNAAVYFPRVLIPDVANGNRPRNVPVSGTLAGVYARTDSTRGIWKAPAGTEAVLRNVTLPVQLTDLENGALNPIGINVLRTFPVIGPVAWGARTLDGADQKASEWKYIPVRRMALYIEESLYQGLKWVVFEPNDEPLWSQIRLNVGAFMQGLFRQGAFQGVTPREAYFVKCDKDTTTQADINLGIVNILVGFAPLKPAEFVIVKIQQMAGQILA